ncbi:MAG: 2OG-Fe(II) oxygenase [Ilumatobacter sp.]|jgi:prolyl 4-hydroxylase|uniref:prolyl hydroxylase family protein n=1 Tax=Ilumatobacter sp. TaxID=1967498 RepID=UPI001D75C9C7|nr:2OG-Fe(II) oxygenase [Ilumatobacter sp.]MBT5277758.1 2OG-Fe(II) oxygenase [Ilumatobacter sp.]MBT5554297.1 2OG-Fe(II) oxygenase [Ilumatobacter sp.]MBT5866492.1 2OG-Fe(II) oxygenase [Ilumatobacter sp.]MDG0976882.1 2OG-Fe(II) oxygenase [Ilumatobacter sp.]
MAMRLKDSYHLGQQVADDPLVQVIDDFVTETERSHIIRLTADKLDTALVSAVGAAKTSDGRTGSVAWVKHDHTPIVRGLVKRVSNLVGIPVRHAESLQVVHYGETQEYKPHFDAYDMTTEKGQQRTAKGGQRLVTALMYLNEVEDGGGTIFPKLDLEVEARPGRMVIFHNVGDNDLEDLTRHRHSLHGGSPVWGGQKWACNLWFRQFPYDTNTTRGQIGKRSSRKRR